MVPKLDHERGYPSKPRCILTATFISRKEESQLLDH